MTDSKERALTPRQQRFVAEYIVDLNASAAAIRAGYSERGASVRGSELLANRKVKLAVEAAKADLAERTGRDQEWVLERLEAVHDASMKETDSGAVHNPAAANRSLELIGKHGGMWSGDNESGDIQILVNLHPWSKDES